MASLNAIGIPTHFVRRLNMREQLVRTLEMIPLEVVVRNSAAGALCKRLGIEKGAALTRPIIEFYYKNDELNDPLVNEDHIAAFNWACSHELEDMIALALRVNDFLSGLFKGAGLRLVDFKIECGREWEGEAGRIILADEISPDTCRLWDSQDQRSLDKDVFRYPKNSLIHKDQDNLIEAYSEVARRLGVLRNQDLGQEIPTLPDQPVSIMSVRKSKGNRTRKTFTGAATTSRSRRHARALNGSRIGGASHRSHHAQARRLRPAGGSHTPRPGRAGLQGNRDRPPGQDHFPGTQHRQCRRGQKQD